MVMDTLCPQSVGNEFVRQYYTVLNQMPLHLHRFYSENSSFVHGGYDRGDRKMGAVYGQHEIHKKIMQLNFREAKTKILLVDAHSTLSDGVVVQVLGELSNNKGPMRKFMQTFVLAPKSPKMYYVYNDIFRYHDEVFTDMTSTPTEVESSSSTVEAMVEAESASSPTPAPAFEAFEAVEGEKNSCAKVVAADGIATVSIMDGHVVLKEQPVAAAAGSQAAHVNGEPSEPVPEPFVEPVEPAGPVVVNDQPEVDEPAKPAIRDKPAQDEPAVPVVVASTDPPTYANLVKASTAKSGATGLVPSGPVNLPPAGFGKQPATAAVSAGSSPVQATSPLPTAAGAAAIESATTPAAMSGGPAMAAASNPGKPFRRGGFRSSEGRYRDTVGSASADLGPESRAHRMAGNINLPDSQQVFVGNLPHTVQEADLKALFKQFGTVADVRISTKGVAQSKNLPAGTNKVPNFGFVAFEDERHVSVCLSSKPILLPPNGHRLNVEPKKKNYGQSRGDDSGYGGPNPGGPNRGAGGPGSGNFDRGSQEHLGQGSGRGGLNSSGRGSSRGGSRGGGRGVFSSGRGGGQPMGSGITPGGGQSQRPGGGYPRRS